MNPDRRAFLAALAALAGTACRPDRAGAGSGKWVPLDFHAHLFGVGDGGTGCRLSPAQRRHVNYRFFLNLLRLKDNGRMDQDYEAALVRQLRASSVSRALLLAQDGRYDASGRFDGEATDAYVPNAYLFEVVRRHPDLFVPCASINPRRRDALDELDRCAAAGARAVKVHPPIQAVDPSEPRFGPFYRRLAEQNLVLMVHTGSEHSSAVADPSLGDPRRLVRALDEGCTVVAAHSGMGSFLDPRPFDVTMLSHLSALAARYPNLYCDTAVLASLFRWRTLPSLLNEPALANRVIYASDWPFTSNAMVFWNRLGPARLLALAAEANLFERDCQIKRALGLSDDAFQRGARLLGLA
jgi:predicted TIM-barrel fold metal-dependent hydrolase